MSVITGRPGVFVSESLNPLVTPPSSDGQATAAFVGAHNSGPVGPTLITSWAQFLALYQGFAGSTDYLPYAVYEFFTNGGSRCYVVRATPSDSTLASLNLNGQETPTPAADLTLTAIAPGAAGNQLFIDIQGTTAGRFNMSIHYGSATSTPVEQYTDVTLNPADPRNLVAMINAVNGGSQYVTATYTGAATWATAQTPGTQTGTPLTGGTDGVQAVSLVTATQLLSSIDGILNVNLPGVSDPTVLNPLIAWAQSDGFKFLVIDSPQASSTYANTVAAYGGLSPLNASAVTPFTTTSYAAVYGPWVNFSDPNSSAPGATRLLPPGGAMLGLFAQADANEGTQQSAAGVKYPLISAVSPQISFQNSDLDTLNQYGINIIRTVPGSAGVMPMGARTLQGGMPSRYVAVRRTLQAIRRMCIQATNFAIFSPNNSILWAQISSILTDKLSILQQSGVLQGSTQGTAFYVICDDTNNTANSVANGIVNIQVGVALNSPAEYIVIQIGQIASGATSSTSIG
jgi:phage tail sheath protein FI